MAPTLTQVALVTAYNGHGQLLVGKRADNEQYTLPCGHIEDGEEPQDAARRELFEETGMRAQTLSFLKHYISSENVELWCFSAFVTGEPHGNYDPDGEVPEWEFIDVEEGLPPNVYNHLHGPKGADNLVMQLFDMKKHEDEAPAAIKPPKVYHSDDWGTARISIPSKDHPDRPKYDQNYAAALRGHYGTNIKPATVGTEQLEHVNEVHSKPRYDLYRKMVREGDRLPPIVLQRLPANRYKVLDGNHKVHASRAEGGGKLDAYVVADYMNKAEEGLVKVALDPNSGYTINHKVSHYTNWYETDPAKRNFQVVSVSAHAPHGEEVGRAILGDDDSGQFSVSHVHVKPEHRRKGLASAMYAHGEKVAGKKLNPSRAQTEDGQALWAGNASAPQFGKAEEELMKALKFKAGFRHPETGHIQTTGSFHDIDQLPEQHSHEYEAGFVDEGGKFYTRREAAQAINPTSHTYQNHLHLDSANLEGDWKTTGDKFRGLNPENLGKAEDEVHRLLAHPDPSERTMALKLGSVSPEHVLAAALDPDPSVHQYAIGHRHFGPTQAHELLEAAVGTDGQYPLVQQAHLLSQHERISPAHLTSFLRGARAHSAGTFDLATKLMAKHPAATAGMLRTAFGDPSTAHDVRMDILGHAAAPEDVLQHAIELGILVPSETSGQLARKASEHIGAPNDTLAKLVYLAADKGDPNVNALAEHALTNGKVSQEVQRDLLMRAMSNPQSTAPRLLEALLRGPSAANMDQGDLDKMVQYAHQAGSATMVKSLSEHPAFGPRHLTMLLHKFEEHVEEPLEKFDSSFLTNPQVHDQFGFKPENHPAFKAASFLADDVRKTLVNPQVLRSALYQADGDFDRAALMAYGIECTEGNLKALHAVMKIGELGKSEPTPATAKEISAARPEGEDVAEAVNRAFADRFAFEIKLGGKHSAGSMICYDQKTKATWLLKSGTGGAGGAAGAAQDTSNPNAREAAFYHVTREWGISGAFPRAELLIIDGHLFAALQWLGGGYKTLDKREKDEPGTARRVLHSYLHDGKLHQWAVADYILGQPDRHGQNVMVDKDGTVKLIDEGSAFAGNEFDPGLDKNSFVPYYLRAWHVDPSFNKLSVDEKLRYMPRVGQTVARSLREWVDTLSASSLGELLQRYEIDPGPTLDRLARVKSAAASNHLDHAINHLWVTT